MAIKKSDLYSSLWESCDELRGGMDASQYKDYILVLLFVKYVSDKAKADPDSLIEVPPGASFDDLLALVGTTNIGEATNKVIAALAEANGLEKVIDLADFDDENKLGKGKELQDRLSKLVRIFADLDFSGSRAEGDDLLGDAYEYLMQHFATESGKSKGQFYTPAEVSRVLAKLLGIDAATRRDQTAYDPTCGSGSLLLKVADEAPRGLTLYGQEKDNATWALAKMNMVLHGNEDATLESADTITSPKFLNGDALATFDFVVSNPPFSIKSWRNGLENEYGRFQYGYPPDKNGDYAFLLHVLASMKSTGKAAVILPHGVLFRGNAEGKIRKELLSRGLIKAVIGLPPNLFYGTGIPACILVLDKENAPARTGVFMIDASAGFIKDGPKNRLRSRDMHKIVDVFTRQTELEGYSRMVPRAEIASAHNEYNLNLARYIDASEPEDLQDLDAHINGGIPDRDVDALAPYWEAAPTLQNALLEPNRPGYRNLKVAPADVQTVVLSSSEMQAVGERATGIVDEWFAAHRTALTAINADTRPADLIQALSEDLLARFRGVPLLDEYAVYEQLMTYWHTVLHDDLFIIMFDGWVEGARPRPVRQTGTDKNGKPKFETPHVTVGTGAGATRLVMDLLPPELVIQRYFIKESAALEALELAAEDAADALREFVTEHAVEDGLVWDAVEDSGKVTQKSTAAAAINAHKENDDETSKPLAQLLGLFKAEVAAKKSAKDARVALDLAVVLRYAELTEDEIKVLVLEDKWHADVSARVSATCEVLLLALVVRLRTLGHRYADVVGAIEAEVATLGARTEANLRAMGV